MTRERAFEIIAAHGADAARWPAAERGTALAMVATDAELQAAYAEAARLDARLDEWSADRPASSDASDGAHVADRLIAAPAPPSTAAWRGPLAGLALAASLAAGALLWPAPPPAMAPAAPAPVVTTDDTPAFAYLFAPTPDEESLI